MINKKYVAQKKIMQQHKTCNNNMKKMFLEQMLEGDQVHMILLMSSHQIVLPYPK